MFSPFPRSSFRVPEQGGGGMVPAGSAVRRGGQSAVLGHGGGAGLGPVCSGRCSSRSNPWGQWEPRRSNVRRLDARPMETRPHGCLSLPA